MAEVNLNHLIQKGFFSKRDLAEHLFPENNYPVDALDRILKGKAYLNTPQLSKLSALLDIPVEELFNLGRWVSVPNKANKPMVFRKDGFEIHLDLKKWETKIFNRGSLFHTTLIKDKSIELQEYFRKIDEIIEHETK